MLKNHNGADTWFFFLTIGSNEIIRARSFNDKMNGVYIKTKYRMASFSIKIKEIIVAVIAISIRVDLIQCIFIL